MFIHLVYQRDLIMKINSSPVLKNPKLTLNKDIQNRKSGYTKSTRSDEFVSSTKNVRKSNVILNTDLVLLKILKSLASFVR